MSFTFAQSAADVFAQEDNNNRVWGVCWIIAQESAHAYGLPDHEYEFVDYNESTCSDPMTYRPDCGGQKFFRNRQEIPDLMHLHAGGTFWAGRVNGFAGG